MIIEDESPPICPIDASHGDMELKTARKGPNAGKKFWGCSTWKETKCKGLVNIEGGDSEDESDYQPASKGDIPRRVIWEDATTRQDGWSITHTTLGASLRSVEVPLNETQTCWLAREERIDDRRVDIDVERVIGIMLKFLQRDSHAPIHPDAERTLLQQLGYTDLIPSPLPGDISPVLKNHPVIDTSSIALTKAANLSLRRITDENSNEEWDFVAWMEKNFPHAVQWLTPQASFDSLLEASGRRATGDRRVDFLLSLPGYTPLVIEIDGSQHKQQQLTDNERDQLLESIQIRTIRIPTTEIHQGTDNKLNQLKDFVNGWSYVTEINPLVWAPIQLHRLMLGICEAVRFQILSGNSWIIEIDDPTGSCVSMMPPYIELFDSLFRLWDLPEKSPERVTFFDGTNWTSYERSSDGSYVNASVEVNEIDVRIKLECVNTPFESLPSSLACPSIVIRSTGLGIEITDSTMGGVSSGNIKRTIDTEKHLGVILRSLFAKDSFREGQCEAIVEILCGRDVTVLLPTGAGKSLIYQFAGICLPGRTIVVDPLVALMEDQISTLRENGINRTQDVSGRTTQLGMTESAYEQISNGDPFFIFVAPERFQMGEFREVINTLKNLTPINLAVIDEAHCVSEWGHDFRTSYLTLGKVLREVCATPSGTPPPLAALTGTASRSVLKDVLFQLDIDESNDNSVIKPTTFDRPELSFNLRPTPVDMNEATLTGVLGSIPASFGINKNDFRRTNGMKTFSGITFVPTVNGKHNLLGTCDLVETFLGRNTTGIYSGKEPRGFNPRQWENIKRENAERFKKNELVALVTTKAFGMGIDKPNIRWVIHYGLPSSMESYYQEVGRAGRDSKPSHCYLILSEFDQERNRELLSLDRDVEDMQTKFRRPERDDVTTAIYFHVGSFPGIENEVANLHSMFNLLQPGEMAQQRIITYSNDRDTKQRALHRLVILGVVKDYLVDYGSNEFTINLAGVTPTSIRDHLIDFVRRSQPNSEQTVEEIMSERITTLDDSINTFGQFLVRFVYQTIERSRRRSLREMWLAVIECSEGEELRQRILDYLTEGDLGPILEELLDSAAPLDEWMITWPTRSSGISEIREWRGSSARLLTSYPDNSALLITRALVEALDEDVETTAEFDSNMIAGISRAFSANIDSEEIERAIKGIFVKIENSSFGERAADSVFASLLIRNDLESETLKDYVSKHWKEHPDMMIYYLSEKLNESHQITQELLSSE